MDPLSKISTVGGTQPSHPQPSTPSLHRACRSVIEGRLAVRKKSGGKALVGAAALALGALVCVPSAKAQTYYWDPSLTDGITGGGAGTWNFSNTGAWFDPFSGLDIGWPDATGTSTAIFGGTAAGTVTIDPTGVTANTLTFNTAGYTLTGGTLTMAQSGSAGIPTLNITQNTTINSVIAGSGNLAINGPGVLNLNAAATFTGNLYLNGGQIILNNPGTTIASAASINLTGVVGQFFNSPDGGAANFPGPFLFAQYNGNNGTPFGSVPINMSGGTLYYHGGPNNGNPSGTVGTVNVLSSAVIAGQPQGGGGDIQITNLNVQPTATVTFESTWAPIGSGAVSAADIGKVLISNFNGTGAAPQNVNGIMGGNFTVVSINNGGSGRTEFASYGPNGVTTATYTTATTVNAAGPTDNYNAPGGNGGGTDAGANTVLSSTTINALNNSDSGGYGDFIITGGTTLTLNSGGLIVGGANHWIKNTGTGNGAITAGSGSLTSGDGHYNLFITVNDGPSGVGLSDYQFNGVQVTDNPADGTAVNIVKGGVGEIIFSTPTTNSGSLIINEGLVQANNGGILGTFTKTPKIIINAGGKLTLNATDALGYTTGLEVVNVNGGTLNANSNFRVTLYNDLTMVGGTLTSGTGNGDGSGNFSLVGTLFATSGANGTPSTMSATLLGLQRGNFNGQSNTFDVTRGGGTIDLNVTGVVGNWNDTASLIRNGNGVMVLSGLNTYSGNTTLNGGTTIAANNAPSGAAGVFGNSTTAVTMGSDGTATNTTLLIDGAFTIGRPITVTNQSGNYTIGGTTNNNAAFTGLITLNSPLTITQAATTGTNALSLTGGITSGGGLDLVTFSGPGNTTVGGGGISDGGGTVGIVINGGTTSYTAANTYTGGTTINSGKLILVGGSLSGSTSALTVNNNGVLDVDGATVTVGNFSGSGGTIVNNGPTAAVLTVGDDSSQPWTYYGVITDGLSKLGFTMGGLGTVTLAGTNTYSGPTVVNSGTLILSSASSNNIANSPTISVLGGGTLDVTGLAGGAGLTLSANQNINGAGIISGALTTVAGSSISPGLGSGLGVGSVGVLTTGNLTIASGTNLNFVIGVPGADNNTLGTASLITVNGNLVLTTGIKFNPVNSQPGLYELFSYTGTLTGFSPSDFITPAGGTYTFTNKNNQIDVLIQNSVLSWTGKTGANADSAWTTGVTSTNWASGTTASSYAEGAIVTFGDINPINGQAITNYGVSIQSAGVNPVSVTFNNSSGNYTIADTGANGIGGTTGIVKNGTGVVNLAGANSFTGSVAINNGAINLQNNAALGQAAAVTVASGAALQLQGGVTTSVAVPLSANGTGLGAGSGAIENVSGNNTYTGPITLQGPTAIGTDTANGVLNLTGGIAGGGNTLYFLGLGTSVVSTAGITGTGTSVTMVGSGTLTLSAIDTYTGATSVLTGTLKLGNAQALGTPGAATSGVAVSDGAILDLNGTNVAINVPLTITGVGAGAGALINSSATTASFGGQINSTNSTSSTFAVGGSGNIVLSGQILGTIASNILTKSGNGTLTLSGTGDNTSLSAVVNGGTLILGKTASGPGGLVGGVRSIGVGLTINSGGTVQLSGSGGDQIYDSASVTISAGGTFDFAGNNETFDALNDGTGGGTITNSGATASTMTVGANGSGGVFSGVIQDGTSTMALTKNGTGTLVLNGANTFSGQTTIAGGVIQVGNANALQNSTAQINVAGGLTFSSGVSNVTLGGLGGSGSIALQDSTASPIALTVGKNNTNTVYSGNLTGGAGLTKVGNGTLALSGTNTIPSLTINSGTVQLRSLGASGLGPITLNGGTLQTQGVGITADYYNNTPPSLNGADPDFAVNSASALDAHFTNLGTPALAGVPTTTGGRVDLNWGNFNNGVVFADQGFGSNQNFEAHLYGQIYISAAQAAAGVVTFGTSSDDGSVLFIDGNLVVNNNFFQGFVAARTGSLTLTPGFHTIDIGMFQGGGGAGFSAYVQFAGGALNPITNAMLNEFVSTNPINLVATSTIDPQGVAAQLGQLTVNPDVTLNTSSGAITFAGTTFAHGADGVYNFNTASQSYVSPGQITDSSGAAAVTINKSGAGSLVFDYTASGQLNTPGTTYAINASAGNIVGVSVNGASSNPFGNAVVNLADGTGFVASSQSGDVVFNNPIKVAANATVNFSAGVSITGFATGVTTSLGNVNLGANDTVITSSTNNYNLNLTALNGSSTASLTHVGGTATLSVPNLSLANVGVVAGNLGLAGNALNVSGALSTSGPGVLVLKPGTGNISVTAGSIINNAAIHVTSGTAVFTGSIGTTTGLAATAGTLTESYFNPSAVGLTDYYAGPDTDITFSNKSSFLTATPGVVQTFGDALSLTGVQVNTRAGAVFTSFNTTNGHAATDNQGAVYYGTITVGGNSVLQPGAISFGLNSDDGSAIYIDANRDGVFSPNELVVSDFGPHGTNNFNGTGATGELTLAAGVYRIAIGWYNGAGNSAIEARFANGDAGGTPTAYLNQTIITPSANPATFSSGPLGAGLSVDGGGTLSAPSASAGSLTLNGVNASALFTGASATTINDVALAADSSGNPAVGTIQVASSAAFNTLSVAANGTLHKTGLGTVTVAGAVIMDSGAVLSVDGGKVIVNGAAGTAGTTAKGTIQVHVGGQLGGTGLLPAVSVSGGVLAPGLNGEAPLSVDGALNFTGSSTLSILITGDAQGSYGQVNMVDPASSVTLAGGNTVHLTLALSNYAPLSSDIFYLVTRADSGSYGGTFAGLPNGAFVSLGNGYGGTITYSANHISGLTSGGEDIAVFNIVPEPGSAVMLLGGMGTLLGLRRFRRSRE